MKRSNKHSVSPIRKLEAPMPASHTLFAAYRPVRPLPLTQVWSGAACVITSFTQRVSRSTYEVGHVPDSHQTWPHKVEARQGALSLSRRDHLAP